MPNLPLNCLKKHANLFLLSTALLMAMPHASFAFGSKAPSPSEAPTAEPARNKSKFLESQILTFNAKYADVDLVTTNKTSDYCGGGEYPRRADVPTSPKYRIAQAELCQSLSPVLDIGLTCEDLVQVNYGESNRVDHVEERGSTAYCYTHSHVYFTASLTNKGKAVTQSSYFYEPSNASVEYNVRAIQNSLSDLQLLPRQRKALDGFFNATDNFVRSMDTEKAKAAQGQESKSLTHRLFVEQAGLLVAYHHYLKDDLAELAQFGSARDGISQRNQNDVQAIKTSIEHLTKAYGLDMDVSSKQVADYGRVLLDLINNFSLTLTANEKSAVQPVLLALVTQVIPTSEAYGDVGAHNAVVALKDQWESDAFQRLLTEKLSVSDERASMLILNMSAATYKLGLSANVDIKTFDARDADRIRTKRLN